MMFKFLKTNKLLAIKLLLYIDNIKIKVFIASLFLQLIKLIMDTARLLSNIFLKKVNIKI